MSEVANDSQKTTTYKVCKTYIYIRLHFQSSQVSCQQEMPALELTAQKKTIPSRSFSTFQPLSTRPAHINAVTINNSA